MAVPQLIPAPTRIRAEGTKPKDIDEFVGQVNTGDDHVSVAHMRSPEGWIEPGQRPDFTEISVVIRGTLHVEFEGGEMDVDTGQAVIQRPGEWVRYSTPKPGGAEYIAICMPAFSMSSVNRDPSP